MTGRWLSAILILAACDAGSDVTTTTAVRDSAGVRIVQSSRALMHAEAARVLAAEPELDIGGGDDPLHQFTYIGGAQQLPGGEVVVGDERGLDLRFYDSGGRYVRTQGRAGRGPGEYTGLRMIDTWSLDTIVVFDMTQRRLTYVNAAGNLLAVEPFSHATPPERGEGGLAWPRYRLADGRWLMEANTASVAPGDPEGLIRNDMVLTAQTADGTAATKVLQLEGAWLYRWWVNERQPAFTMVPLTVRPSIAVTPDGDIVVAGGVAPEVRRYAADGTLSAIYRIEGGAQPLVRAVFDSVVAAEIAAAGARAPGLRRVFGSMDVPAHRPTFDAIMVDVAGRVWARTFDVNRDAARTWIVFDADGVVTGTISTPARFDLLEIGDAYVLGRSRDEFDVQRLRRYRIEFRS